MSTKSLKGPAAPKQERVNPFILKKNVQKPAGVVGKLRPISKAELLQIISRLPTVCQGEKIVIKKQRVVTPVLDSSDEEDLLIDFDSPVEPPQLPAVPTTSRFPPAASVTSSVPRTRIHPAAIAPIPEEESKEHKLVRLVASSAQETEASLEAIRELIRSGEVNLNHKVDNGTTPLILAVKRKHLRTAQLLLDAGADIDLQDDEGRTPLNWATHRETEEMVHLLLCNKASPILQNKKGETCFYTALNERAKKMQELLAFSQVCCWRPGLPLNLLNTSDYKRNKFFAFVKSDVTKFVRENGLPESEIPKVLGDSEINTPAMEAILSEGLAWDPEVTAALETLGLSKYSKLFAKHRVTFQAFLSLTQRDLIEIGICGLAILEKILAFTRSHKSST